MNSYGLDGVPSLNPTFTDQSLDPLKRKEREALHMAQVLKELATQRQEAENRKTRVLDSEREKARAARRRDFLAKRGRPAPAPRPSRGFYGAHEADAQAFNADREALSNAAAKDNGQVRAIRQVGVDRESRKAAFKAMRRGDATPHAERSQEIQTLKPEAARAFSKEQGQSSMSGFRHATAETPSQGNTAAHKTGPTPSVQRQPTVAPSRTSFARTIDL